MSCSKAIPSKYEAFDKLYQACLKDKTRLVANYEALLFEGIRVGLAYRRKFNIKDCIVHRANRDGLIITAQRIRKILNDLDLTGVSPSQNNDATAFEEPTEEEKRLNEKAFILKLMADDWLPRYEPGTGLSSTVACSHFIQSLKAIDQALVPSICKRAHTLA